MSDDKLGKWLEEKGFLKSSHSTGKSSGAASHQQKSSHNKKNSPSTRKQTEKSSTQGTRVNRITGKPHGFYQNEAKNSSDRKGKNTRSTGFSRSNGNATDRKSSGHSGGFRGGRPSGPMAKTFSNNDPFLARPTVEKREKFHPTKYLPKIKAGEIRVVPLGGMEQVGENMMFLEWEDDIVIIDTGFLFPGPEHLGVDVLIPDISYLEKNKHKIRGIIYTHGHLDHIGGVPYIVPKLGFPKMYATALTKELIEGQASEKPEMLDKLKIQTINPKSKLKLGKFEFEFYHINHSIPDGVAVVAKTPYGHIVHSSDFKFDYNPADDQPIDLARIAQIGKQGVALAMSDSTSTMKPGHTPSESKINATLEKCIEDAPDRIVLATFASNIGRISKIVESAEKNGRTVFLSGRSMERNIAIARKLNYLKCKDRSIELMSSRANQLPPSKVLILSTGSQGEELAALTRMAAGTHRDIRLTEKDTVIFSSSPIPGNEMAIVSVRNNLAEIGCRTIDHRELDIHVSGHAHAEECKLLISLLNPKYFAPIHGEVFMRYAHRDMIVNDLQMKKENTFIMKNGQGVVLGPKGARLMTEKEIVAGAERLVQLGEEIHDDLLEERKFMSETGIIIALLKADTGRLKKCEIRAKGFLYTEDDHEIFRELEKLIKQKWESLYDPSRPESALITPLKESVQRFFLQKFRKEQMVEMILV